MALPPSSSFPPAAAAEEPLTLDTPSLYLRSYRSFSEHLHSPPNPPPLPVDLLSRGSPLPPIPHDAPKAKLIPGTRFVVDGFRPAVSAGDFSVSYFLSHFHSDHYAGLGPGWCRGIVYCSGTTAALLVEVLKLSPLFVTPLALGRTVRIDGCEVAAVDANHCPGAVQFLFKVPVGDDGRRLERYVHTGDFRFSDAMRLDPVLQGFVGPDAVFLDTTYCNPKFTFPTQEESIEYVVGAIEKIMAQSKGFSSPSESVLILIATYVVGKERILLEISRRCNCRLHVDGRKMTVLRVLGYGDSGVFTEDASATDVHVIGWNLLGETWPYFRPNFVKMKEIMADKGYSKVVGFVPTGWMYETKKEGFAVRVKDSFEIHLVPYSEHSNYSELREYVRFLRPKRVIPTVGGVDIEKLDSKQSVALLKHFSGLINETANKHGFLMAFHQKPRDGGEKNGNEPVVRSNEGGDVKVVTGPSQKSLDSEEDGSLQKSKTPNGDMEETIEELKRCLPSWVSKEQMVGLLTGTGGDMVEAVSEFYERETELFEQANSSGPSVSLATSHSEMSRAIAKLDNIRKPILAHTSLVNTDVVTVKTISPKKRGQTNGNKSKKKGKLTSESSGCKQFTITKYFGKLTPDNACQDIRLPSSTTEAQLSVGKLTRGEPIETFKGELDQFLQITNGSMSKSAASLLLEKVKGNISAALDLYYSNDLRDNDGSGDCTMLGHPQDGLENNVRKSKDKLSEPSTNMVVLPIVGDLVEDRVATLVSLPLEKYSPSEHACWKAGQPVPYLHLARTFGLLEQEKGKTKTTLMLCNMFRSLLALSPEDVLSAVYLCTNKIAPDYENMGLNIGFGMVTTALEEACGTSRSKIKDMYDKFGDLGDVAQMCRQTQKLLVPPRPISVNALFAALQKLSTETGSGCSSRKKNIIVNLMCSCREIEIKFLVRTLVRNLRIGAMMKTILPALAQAVVWNSAFWTNSGGCSESLKAKLEFISSAVVEAYNILPNLDLLIPALLSKGVDFSPSTLVVVPGMPIPSMLAKITNGIPEVLKTIQGRAFTCEYKYDGQRAQIHKQMDGSIRVFSRNMGETTHKFPDLVNIIQASCSPTAVTFIVDVEVVAVDRKKGNMIMPFQHLSSRDRGSKGSSVALDSIKVEICIFLFDTMFYNGNPLLPFSLRERRRCLRNIFVEEKTGYLEFAKEITVEADRASISDQETITKLHSFLEEACTSSCEGIMVKSLDADAGYAASKRTDAWLKVKRDYVEGLGDSLDLVPIGAWHGNGRKAGWYSPFLVACYNNEGEEFQSVCRVMSGFSDSFYAEMKEYFSGEKILPRKPLYYRTDETPDLWFSPELVWEIRGAEFTVSPVHHAAISLIHPSRGISMRFPRYVRSILDRKPEDCSTAADIADMFRSQPRRKEVNMEE